MDPSSTKGTGHDLPALEPVQVAPEDEVEALVRAARAGIAMLSLQLRSARQELELADQRADGSDYAGARELIDASLTHWIDSRRVQMAQELEHAREEAANLVSAAHAEAANVVARASEDSLAALLAGTRSRPDGGAPNLRVVPQQHPSRPTVPEEPRVAVVAPSIAVDPAADLATEAPPEPAPVLVSSVTETVSAPPVAANPPTESEIVVEPATPSRAKQLLHLDVLLPMVAVLIVILVLLAWVG